MDVSIVKSLVAIFVLFLAFVHNTHNTSFAQTGEFEIRQASKCNNFFPAYERKYSMPKNLLRAISITESGKWSKAQNKDIAWPWTINVSGKGYHYNSKSEAISAVKKFRIQGVSNIDVGCMQINLKYHPQAFKSLEQAFDPRYNIAYAAKFLAKKHKIQKKWSKAIGHYHNRNPELYRRYVKKVFDTWKREDKSFNVATLDRPAMFIKVTNRPGRHHTTDVSDITRSALEKFGR